MDVDEELVDREQEDDVGQDIDELECLMKYQIHYKLMEGNGEEEESSDGEAVLKRESLSVEPKIGDSLSISYVDMLEIEDSDYTIVIHLQDNKKLHLTELGYNYETFLENMVRLRNALLLKDLLMEEAAVKQGVEADFVYMGENSVNMEDGECEAALYETGIILQKRRGMPVRIPYSVITKVMAEDYRIEISLESDEKYILTKMGRQYDSFQKELSNSITKLSTKAQSVLKELLPDLNSLALRKVSSLMRDGKAAGRSSIESISPKLWEDLEKRLYKAGLQEQYGFLNNMARKDKVSIGIKRGLMGNLTGDYIWFLSPIYDLNGRKYGNAVALEASSSEGMGKATYFFRIIGRKEYKNTASAEYMDIMTDKFIKKFNYAMLSINFRREPIYLTDRQLDMPGYSRYKVAVQALPSLRYLRGLFIGRVLHSSSEQWKNDVLDLLDFNLSVDDDTIRWQKGKGSK